MSEPDRVVKAIDQAIIDMFLDDEQEARERLGDATAEDLAYEPVFQTMLLARLGACLARLAVLAEDIRDTLRLATDQEHL